MMYGSWDMERSRPNRIFCHFWHFLPFYSTNNSIFEKMKKYTRTNHHFTQEYQKLWSYDILFLRYSTWGMKLLYFILGYFYTFNSPSSHLTAQKRKKKEKRPEDILILHMCTKNYDQMMYGSWDIVRDGRTDRRKKWHIGAGVPPNKSQSSHKCIHVSWVIYASVGDERSYVLKQTCGI